MTTKFEGLKDENVIIKEFSDSELAEVKGHIW